MNQDRNRLRAFADVVSVDAWHQSFNSERREVDLKVDVVFSEGRVGGEASSPVQFRLRLRKAILMVITPETEPVDVVRESIRREHEDSFTEWSEETVRKKNLSASAGLELSLSKAGASGGAEVGLKGKNEASSTLKEIRSGKIQPMKTIFRYDNIENTYTWVIDCDSAEHLDGRAWDANTSPLLRLKDIRTDPGRGIAPSVRVGVKCLREDLIITDIRLKSDISMKEKILGNEDKIKLKAAEAYIRTKLCEVGLDVGDLGNDFARVILMDVSAKTEE